MEFSPGDINIVAFIFPSMRGEGAKLLTRQGRFLLQQANHVFSPQETIDGSKNTLSRVLVATAAESRGDKRDLLQFNGTDSWVQKWNNSS